MKLVSWYAGKLRRQSGGELADRGKIGCVAGSRAGLDRAWPSPLLATAGMAGIAALLSGVSLAKHVFLTSEPTHEALSSTSVEDPLPSPTLLFFGPEPAAGPPTDLEGDGLSQLDTPLSATSSPLVQIPEAPLGLDDVVRTLQQRRAEILELEARLALREAAVRAAEADVKAQLERLESFRLELEGVVGAAEAEEEERLQQLVKMYESMRAKSAAAIFDQLELPVVLAVAKRMREARMAAILAAMNPNRARIVTTELARERELPRLE